MSELQQSSEYDDIMCIDNNDCLNSLLDDINDISFNDMDITSNIGEYIIGDEWISLENLNFVTDDNVDTLTTNNNNDMTSIKRGQYENLLHDKTCSIGKFIRDMNITFIECKVLWPLLKKCPKKVRQPYGKRINQTDKARKDTTRYHHSLSSLLSSSSSS